MDVRSSKRLSDGDGGEKKRQKNSEYTSSASQPAEPCFVWVHIGSFSTEINDHSKETRVLSHEQGELVKKYLSYGNNSFIDCKSNTICTKCYKDFMFYNKKDGELVPLWHKKRRKRFKPSKICAVCATTSSSQWSPENWLLTHTSECHRIYDGFDISKGYMCNIHYKEVIRILDNLLCIYCKATLTKETFVCPKSNFSSVQDYYSRDDISLTEKSVLCRNCYKSFENKDSTENEHYRACLQCENFIKDQLTANEFIHLAEVKDFYEHLFKQDEEIRINYFYRFIDNFLHNSEYQSFSAAGKIILYDSRTMSITIVKKLFEQREKINQLQQDIELLSNSSISSKNVQNLVKQQCKEFPSPAKHDFRDIFETDKVLVNMINSKLYKFLDMITSSPKKNDKKSNAYNHLRKLKLILIISVLCNTMNPQVTYLQTILGIVAYTNGLTENGMHILNRFGIVCSSDLLSSHGNFWAEKRNAVEELNSNAFWRVSFDNLNFNMKYAKTFRDSGSKMAKMLNLLTSQVTHRTDPVVFSYDSPDTEGAQTCTQDSFSVLPEKPDGVQWAEFKHVLSQIFLERRFKTPKDQDKSYIIHLRDYFPCKTPPAGDKVVFATVDEAESSQESDICSYLLKMKGDLNIGKPGFPQYVVIAGDQQTYSLVKGIKKTKPYDFGWVYAVPGDWHLMKLLAENLIEVIREGGLKEFLTAMGVGKPDSVKSWQDIHMYLLSIHEALYTVATTSFVTNENLHISPQLLPNVMRKWLDNQMLKCNNSDEVCRFWSSFLHMLDVYVGFYFSIRSGNWDLRVATLKLSAKIFFAYSRNKYEELVAETICDIYKFPACIVDRFRDGEWTVSLLGNPYRNLALDEAHECVINRKIKSLTTRPSYFRTVQLADFIAYVEAVLDKFNTYVFQHLKSSKLPGDRINPGLRTSLLLSVIQPADLFSSKNRELKNVFTEKVHSLPNLQRSHLLSIMSVGEERLEHFVSIHVLKNKPPQKRKRNKLSTFTVRKQTNRRLKSQISQGTTLLKLAYAEMEKHGILQVQTSPYPLALCDENGQLRKRQKSKFKDALCSSIENITNIFTDQVPFPVNGDTEVIIDLLRFLHEPPPRVLENYQAVGDYFYKRLVTVYGEIRKASMVTIVCDKPNHLPPVREIVHSERGVASGDEIAVDINLEDKYDQSKYCDFMKSYSNKQAIISFVCKYLCKKAFRELPDNLSVIVDAACMGDFPVVIKKGVRETCLMRANKQGEADYAMWFHASQSNQKNIIVCASDTDIYMFGLALMENGKLKNKLVAVERKYNIEYVNINQAYEHIKSHEKLKKIAFPCAALCVVYLTTGSDYVENIKYVSSLNILKTFIENCDFITRKSSLIEFQENRCSISIDSLVLLISCAYMKKHLSFFPDKQIDRIFDSLVCENVEKQYLDVLCRLGWESNNKLTHVKDWIELIRTIIFNSSSKSANREFLLCPSHSALVLHSKRTEYAFKLAMEATSETSCHILKYEEYGWFRHNDKILVKWEENIGVNPIKDALTIHKCSCKSGCNSNRCRGCFGSCKPCSIKCKCVDCKNPHQNGGTCEKCAIENNLPVAETYGERNNETDNELLYDEISDNENELGVETDSESEQGFLSEIDERSFLDDEEFDYIDSMSSVD